MTFEGPEPAALRISRQCCIERRACASPPSTMCPLEGSRGICPETKTSPLPRVATETGEVEAGALAVTISSLTCFAPLKSTAGSRW